MKPKVRNPMGIHVHKRVAGKHGKTVKATRHKEKMETQMRGRSFNGEAFGFYPNELGSIPGAPTIILEHSTAPRISGNWTQGLSE